MAPYVSYLLTFVLSCREHLLARRGSSQARDDFVLNRKGVSQIVGAVLVLLITIVAGTLAYAYAAGLLGPLQPPPPNAPENLTIEMIAFSPDGSARLTVRNLGTADSKIGSIYVDGNLIYSSTQGTVIPIGEAHTFILSKVSPTQHWFKVATLNGFITSVYGPDNIYIVDTVMGTTATTGAPSTSSSSTTGGGPSTQTTAYTTTYTSTLSSTGPTTMTTTSTSTWTSTNPTTTTATTTSSWTSTNPSSYTTTSATTQTITTTSTGTITSTSHVKGTTYSTITTTVTSTITSTSSSSTTQTITTSLFSTGSTTQTSTTTSSSISSGTTTFTSTGTTTVSSTSTTTVASTVITTITTTSALSPLLLILSPPWFAFRSKARKKPVLSRFRQRSSLNRVDLS